MPSNLMMFFILGVLLMTSCSDDDTTQIDCTGVTPTYSSEIAPIINVSCAFSGCHDSATKSDGIDLSTYANVKSASANDNFLKSIKHESGATAMPQSAEKLPNESIKMIECWIQNGWPQ
ncbi:MAG: hypothetical protein R2774_08980 [Saprospiraceae bacterium]